MSLDCLAQEMDLEDFMFIFYILGFIGKLKGVMYIIVGYMLGFVMMYCYILDYWEGDIFWCMVDVGWIIGYFYIVYGLLVNGVIMLMFEGVLIYLDVLCCWQVVDKYKVNMFYIVFIVICVLMSQGNELVKKFFCVSLCLLGMVGELINLEVWEWYYNVVGEICCLVVDIWW